MIQRRFVVSTRSIADKKTQAGSSSINQRNPNSDHAEGVLRARGFFVHYLALTFSTLLSSQVSGAHRTELVGLRLGAATHITRSSKSESNPDLLVHPGPSEGPDLMHLLRAHIYPNISLASGFLPGRPLQIDNLTRPAPPLRPHILYACATERSNRPDRCACASYLCVTRGRSWVFRVLELTLCCSCPAASVRSQRPQCARHVRRPRRRKPARRWADPSRLALGILGPRARRRGAACP